MGHVDISKLNRTGRGLPHCPHLFYGSIRQAAAITGIKKTKKESSYVSQIF